MEYVTNFKWTIKNFTTLASPTGPNAALISDDFPINGTKARSSLVFCHTSPHSKKKSSMFIQVKIADEDLRANSIVKLWMSNKSGQRIGNQKVISASNFFTATHFMGFQSTVKKSKLYPSSSFIQGNTVFIECEIVLTVPGSSSDITMIKASYMSDRVLQGCIVIAGKKPFFVSKHLLTSKSVRFEQLLNSDSNEARTGLIHLQSMEPQVFNAFKYFIYFGQLSFNCPFHVIDELFAFAFKYGLDQLKADCKGRLLQANCKFELIICLKVGFTYGDEELSRYAFFRLRELFPAESEVLYFNYPQWIQFAANDLNLAMGIKIAVYKAIGILPEEYER